MKQAIIIETFGHQSSSDATNNVLVRDKDSTFTSSGSFEHIEKSLIFKDSFGT